MVASSRDGLFTEDFGVTALLELYISGWLWEDFALVLSLEVFVHQVGMGSSLPLCLVPLGCQQHVSSASSRGFGVHPAQGGSWQPCPSAAWLRVSMGTCSRSILWSSPAGEEEERTWLPPSLRP